MKLYTETSLQNFDFWSGADDNASMLTGEQLDAIENILEMENPEGMDATELNDLFRYDFETVCAWIGLTYDPETDEIIDPDDQEDED